MSVTLDLSTIKIDVGTVNTLMNTCQNLVLSYMRNYKRKKRVGIFSRGRANVGLFELVGKALQTSGMMEHARLINLYKPQITEITQDDVSFDRGFKQDELQEVNFIPLGNSDATAAIMEQLPMFDLAVLGLPNPISEEHFLWNLVKKIQDGNGVTSFILVYQQRQRTKDMKEANRQQLTHSDPTTLFLRNTFPKDSFKKEWIKQKKFERKQKIGLVIPAFNEEETVANVIACYMPLKKEGILDRIVVMDNDSTDGTSRVAKEAGAEVYRSGDVFPEFGAYRGKGEALWKSLFVVNNMDIVAFLDADIKNPTEEMVLNIVGPLVLRKDLQLVKGYFNRGGAEDKTLKSGGGRVTEILVRPLLSMEMPELLFLFQPLSGFTAARMELLKSLPFYTGYGIEIGFLLHTAKVFGVSAIAQSDVGWIIHRNQGIEALTRMGTEVLQAFKDASDTEDSETKEIKTSLIYALLSTDKYSLLRRNVSQLKRPPLQNVLKNLPMQNDSYNNK